MPQFQLITDNAPAYDDLDDLAKGFIECLFFTNQCSAAVFIGRQDTGEFDSVFACAWPREEPDFIKADWARPEIQDAIREGQSDGTIPSDAGVADLSDDALTAIRDFCARWYADNRADADAAADLYGMNRVGNDLAYTAAGHGVGFSDRNELPEDLRERLHVSALHEWDVTPVYVAETGKIEI